MLHVCLSVTKRTFYAIIVYRFLQKEYVCLLNTVFGTEDFNCKFKTRLQILTEIQESFSVVLSNKSSRHLRLKFARFVLLSVGEEAQT